MPNIEHYYPNAVSLALLIYFVDAGVLLHVYINCHVSHIGRDTHHCYPSVYNLTVIYIHYTLTMATILLTNS